MAQTGSIVIDNFSQVTAQIESERGVSRADLKAAIEQALVSACRRRFSEEAELEAEIDEQTGEAKIYLVKTVVESVENDELEIGLKEAQKVDKSADLESKLKFEVTPDNFGRIAAQTAKQVIIQRIREAEKNSIYDEFIDKQGQIITGTVQRIENRNYLINLGRIEALLMPRDQIPNERLEVKEKVRFYVVEVSKTSRRPHIHISRSHPGLLKCLFEAEIPEIQDGIIEIMSLSREAGKRSKVAVKSNNPAVGAVGTCVGHMGGRIQSIIKELGNEKIDILEWKEDPKDFIANSLKPAKIKTVVITNPDEKEAVVVVPQDQLSLAIGKMGVNVRLAVKLTGWKLDILSEDEYSEKEGELGQAKGPSLSMAEKIKLEAEKLKSGDTDSEEETSVDLASSKLGAQILAQKEEAESAEIKVSELAKDMGMKTKDLMEAAAGIGFEIKSNRVKLTEEQAAELREKLG